MKRYFLLPLLSLFLFLSCSDDNNTRNVFERNKNIYEVLDETMNEWYLWNEDLPNLNANNYSSPNVYFEDLLVDKDRWSYIANLDALLAFFENGTYTGFGLAFKFDQNNDLRVKLIYEASPLFQEGVRRGWQLVAINNFTIPENSNDSDEDRILDELDKTNCDFVFETPLGERKTINASQIELDQNTVLKRDVIDYGGKKVAYLAFDSFLDKSEAELNEAFTYFKEQNAEELVLDMRYNGGGSTYISNQLASLITGNTQEGNIYAKVFHSTSKSGENSTDAFAVQNAAYGFNRIFVITTSSTASASEMVINGLKPYLDDVILIGSKTHGKPVGMYVFEDRSLNLAIVPISFSITNANDEGDYFEGIPVDLQIADDLLHDFGDIEESNLHAALEYIKNNSFPVITATKAFSTTEREFKKKGLDELIDAN